MGAFDTAWRVLKNERELRQIGEGGFRAVYEGDNENEVIKVPRRGLPSFELSHNALMNAFAQLGYPVEPEKLQILPPHRAINPQGGPGGRMAMDPVTVRPFNTLGYTQRRADIAGKNKIEDIMDEREYDIRDDLLGVHGPNFYGRRLRENISPAIFRTYDLKPSNLGVFDGEIRALDALTTRPSHLMDKNSFLLAHGLADLPEAERRSLVNLFTDKSQFQDIADYDFSQENSLPLSQRENAPKLKTEGYAIDHRNDKFVPQTPMELAHNAYSRYLQDVRAMQLANSMVEDPYQTRLDEFVNPQRINEEALRAAGMGKARRDLIERTGNLNVDATHTFPSYPGLETLFPPPAPPPLKVDAPPQPYLPMNQYTNTGMYHFGPAPGA